MINRENIDDFASQSNSSEMNPNPNTEGNFSFFSIHDIVDPVPNTQGMIFDLALKVYDRNRITFDGYERKSFSFNHFELIELYYSIVRETLRLLQSPEINSVQELGRLSINTLPLFMEPIDVTEEEWEWSRKVYHEGEENMVEIELPLNSMLHYAINVRRISEGNKSNPFFNWSIIELLNPSPNN